MSALEYIEGVSKRGKIQIQEDQLHNQYSELMHILPFRSDRL